jgi:hypothetical protein
VSIRPADNGLEIEIVGEIAKMVELGIRPNAKQATLGERLTRSVKVVAGARNHLYRTRFLWSHVLITEGLSLMSAVRLTADFVRGCALGPLGAISGPELSRLLIIAT